MIDLFMSESSDHQLHCGTAVSGPGSGRCKNPRCRKPSATLLSGYCISCAVARNINPMRDCGCQPIVLEDDSEAADSAGSGVPSLLPGQAQKKP